MASVFDRFYKTGPATFVLKAIVFVIVADVLLLGFILLRRTYRKRYFKRRDAQMFRFRQQWASIISGAIPYGTWRTKTSDRHIIETMALDALEVSSPEEAARLLKFMRASGLIEKRIADSRQQEGWKRHRALVALGRTRAPEGIPALGEGLRSPDPETRLAALRGLERMACPEAAKEILEWVAENGIAVPELPLQSALVQTCAERPQLLLPYLNGTHDGVRETLGRVLAEVATPSVVGELMHFADDPGPELRAAAARGLAFSSPRAAIGVLGELAQDKVWFVRLRAIVSLGRLCHELCLPLLLRGLSDSNRLVRLRAAEGLVDFKADLLQIFQSVIALRDQYGLHAFLTAIENAGVHEPLNREIEASSELTRQAKAELLDVLRTQKLPLVSGAQAILSSHSESRT